MPSAPFSLLLPTASSSTSWLTSRPSSPRLPLDSYDCESSDEPSSSSPRSSYSPSIGQSSHHSNFFAHATTSSSNLTSIYHTPLPSRAPSRASSPGPQAPQYFTTSEDDQPTNTLLPGRISTRFTSPPRRKWWTDDSGRRVRRRSPKMRAWRRALSAVLSHPLFPTQPTTILLSITVILIMCLSLTLFLMYLLNPDKAPLPWRSYCSLSPPFPEAEMETLPPVGIFIGVMSTDSAVERRMLIRSTWAKHSSSRGTNGGTSRTIVRFILGISRSDWTRRIQLEAETYRDIILLPIPENMNYGKTHAYVSWAHHHALVPPPASLSNGSFTGPETSPYAFAAGLSPYDPASFAPTSQHLFPSFNKTHGSPAPAQAPHDPILAHHDANWVRPQFVIKADDDSFIMLAELEARLRLEWYDALVDSTADKKSSAKSSTKTSSTASSASSTLRPVIMPQRMTRLIANKAIPTSVPFPVTRFEGEEDEDEFPPGPRNVDPMIYWGYLVKARFMAGELYALSSALVEYIANDHTVSTMTHGAEDKQTAKWVRSHPRAEEVRWRSERCWIYDHPRAGTVYSHGFLFPSEAARIRHETTHGLTPAQIHLLPTSTSTSDPSLTHSTVSRFGMRYVPPSSNLTTEMEVEALVEGSPMSRLRDETIGGRTSDATWSQVRRAWRKREPRHKRFNGSKVGGTIVVHFIKRNEWFLETALALLEDETAENDPEKEDGPVDMELSELEEIAEGAKSGYYGYPPLLTGRPDRNRVETDLSNKTPLDFSNLDPEPEASPEDMKDGDAAPSPVDPPVGDTKEHDLILQDRPQAIFTPSEDLDAPASLPESS